MATKLCSALACWAALMVNLVSADVQVYPSPGNEFVSDHYRVRVVQGSQEFDSFTYMDENSADDLRDRMTDFNHWTTLAFTDSIEIEVTLLTADAAAAGSEVRPLAAKISPTIGEKTVRFKIDQPGKFWIKVPGHEEHPLFVFADPPETNVPRRGDAQVLWFEAGKVHDVGPKYRLKSGDTVYIEGGAYVKGTFTGDDVTNVRICGRGILSGIDIPRKPGVEGIPWNLVMFNGRGEQTVEGITCIQPPHFVLLSRGQFAVRDTKLFGWYHQTDGWGGGAGSTIEDSFLKVNDDSVKLYAAQQSARRLTIWQQVNGAPFQLGWGGDTQNAEQCVAEDITILRCENTNRPPRKPSNTALVNLQSQSPTSQISGVEVRNVRIEDDTLYLLGMKDVDGRVEDVLLQDITVLGRVRGPSYLLATRRGHIAGVRYERITIDGKRADNVETLTAGDVAPLIVE